ncbi:hypothetical protein PSQ19_00285 [Devosia algicola]|uniref:Uncharacterized protein n=1 Tax=Devosia algicola TaxID=3026418 RepID=A0ABY7YNB0_9HYPH|nr:hypothetical protein [Devosia algicola]WDR02719.1 hypothetical protein PSQ19_00285 [Devosia algicola]
MNQTVRVIAIFAANSALSSILAMVVGGDTRLRVRQFDSVHGLRAYMRVAPVDVLVCDFDSESAPAGDLVYDLRRDESR